MSVWNETGDPLVRVFAPECDAEFPLVVFGHANNKDKCRLVDSYDSLLSYVASHGFVVAIVDHEDLSCHSANADNIEARAQSLSETRRRVQAWGRDPDHRLAGKVGPAYVYTGHSRGAGAALIATHEDEAAPGVVALQPISLRAYQFRELELRPFEVLSVVAENDSDLRFPHVDTVEDMLPSSYSSVVLGGALHTWSGDAIPQREDAEPGTTLEAQQRATGFLMTAFVSHLVGIDETSRSIFFSHELSPLLDELIESHYHRWLDLSRAAHHDPFDDLEGELEGRVSFRGDGGAQIAYTYGEPFSTPRLAWQDAVSLEVFANEGGEAEVELSLPAEIEGPFATLQVQVRSPEGWNPARVRIGAGCEGDRLEEVEVGRHFQHHTVEAQGCTRLKATISEGVVYFDDFVVTN